MKAVLFSLLLAVIFVVAPTNTEDIRDPRQTLTQCQRMLQDNRVMIISTVNQVNSTCTLSCTSNCRSLLNNLKSHFGCCLESYGTDFARRSLNILLAQCAISPPGPCDISSPGPSDTSPPGPRNHASRVIITFSTIAIFSAIAYFVNRV